MACNAQYFSKVQCYESHARHIIFFIGFHLPYFLWFFVVSQNFPHNCLHAYSSGIVLDQFLVMFWYFLYYFTAKVRKSGQKYYHNYHSTFQGLHELLTGVYFYTTVESVLGLNKAIKSHGLFVKRRPHPPYSKLQIWTFLLTTSIISFCGYFRVEYYYTKGSSVVLISEFYTLVDLSKFSKVIVLLSTG